MPPQRTSARARPRQDPVSCQLCRVKKLKCDRQRPCSNCQSRRLTCEYQGERGLTAADSGTPEDDGGRSESRAVKARLERLEQAVFGSQPPSGQYPNGYPSTSTAASTPPPRVRPDGEKVDEDSHWLESIGTRSQIILPQFSDPFLVNLRPIEQIIANEQGAPRVRSVELPPYDVAMSFLGAYGEHLDAMQHILHIEHTRQTFEKAYSQISSMQNPESGALALILGVCASVGLYWAIGHHRGPSLFDDHQTALTVATEWTRQSLYAIEQARAATTETSLEAVQASVLLTFLFYHLEGFTFRVRMMHATALAMARDQGLHKTDAARPRAADWTQSAIIDNEVRRKVWWHLACTDWLLSYIRGPQEGMYSIHPHQVHVNQPRNLTREDLNKQGPDFHRGALEPTVMSYYLQRIKLAAICREISDNVWCTPDPEMVNYDLVMAMDAKFETQIRDLPRFLRFDIPSQELLAEYGTAFTAQIDSQRVMANQMLNTMKCKLHLPFLIRAKSNPRFAFSRAKALQSARTVFNIRRTVMEQDSDETVFTSASMKLAGIMLHIFYATVVLVLDICINKDEVDASHLAEVRDALKIIEEGKDSSEMGAKFADSLVAVLRKHHVKLPKAEAADPTQARASFMMNGKASYQQTLPYHEYPMSTDAYAASTTMPMDTYPAFNGGAFDANMMQDFILDQGPLLAPQEWEDVLNSMELSNVFV